MEVKIGLIYELGARLSPYARRQELIKREIIARRCGWEELARQFWAAMQRAGVHEGDRLVAVADGAHASGTDFRLCGPASDAHPRLLSRGRTIPRHR